MFCCCRRERERERERERDRERDPTCEMDAARVQAPGPSRRACTRRCSPPGLPCPSNHLWVPHNPNRGFHGFLLLPTRAGSGRERAESQRNKQTEAEGSHVRSPKLPGHVRLPLSPAIKMHRAAPTSARAKLRPRNAGLSVHCRRFPHRRPILQHLLGFNYLNSCSSWAKGKARTQTRTARRGRSRTRSALARPPPCARSRSR
jgi:hypothetical protein